MVGVQAERTRDLDWFPGTCSDVCNSSPPWLRKECKT